MIEEQNDKKVVKDSFDGYLSYATEYGKCLCGDSLEILDKFEDNSIDLLITSPPFALQRQKEYGNQAQNEYVDWFLQFASVARHKLKDAGSMVIDLGGSYCKGRPVRSLYQYRLLIKMCDDLQFNLAEEFFWYNPSKLPSPIEWVNKRKIRAKDSVNTNWWFSKTDYPKADVKKVLNPYSKAMKKLLSSEGTYYIPNTNRPSGHRMSDKFNIDNGGAIPSNLLQISNTESNGHYLSFCKKLGIKGHPARFPIALPGFYIDFLTDEGDLVVDIFSGSNTTGLAAEQRKRRWITIELNQEYMATSVLRFSDTEAQAKERYESLMNGQSLVL